jgi:hypothetical protein
MVAINSGGLGEAPMEFFFRRRRVSFFAGMQLNAYFSRYIGYCTLNETRLLIISALIYTTLQYNYFVFATKRKKR